MGKEFRAREVIICFSGLCHKSPARGNKGNGDEGEKEGLASDLVRGLVQAGLSVQLPCPSCAEQSPPGPMVLLSEVSLQGTACGSSLDLRTGVESLLSLATLF